MGSKQLSRENKNQLGHEEGSTEGLCPVELYPPRGQHSPR